jgi:hypothetical protein
MGMFEIKGTEMIMNGSLHKVATVIKSNGILERITQEPFDHDSSHYRRLCDLRGGPPDASDLVDYALDMQYMELQPDLLRHLTPVLLASWRKDLFEGNGAGYAGFVEQFWPALLKGAALQTVFADAERAAFIGYVRDSILERLDTENSLKFSGMSSSPYRWVQALVSYGVLFSDIEVLWTEWWKMQTHGHAVAAFQYASALMYEDDKNPVFDAWTRDKGGGPPALWECGCHMYDVGWKQENLSFLSRTLSVDYIERNLRVASDQIQIEPAREAASRVLRELPNQKTLLALRIEELPRLLMNVSQVEGFTI